MPKTYKICILLKDGNKEIDVTQMSSMEFDRIFGFSELINWNVENVKKLVDIMIRPDYLNEFYSLMDENRRFSGTYKSDLLSTLLSIHFEDFLPQEKRLAPFLVFVSKEFSSTGFMDIPFLKKEWLDYEKVINQLIELEN